MIVVLPIFRSCYTLKVQFMSLLISLGILPMLKEQDIGAESCHIDSGVGKGIVSLKTLQFPLMCGHEQVSHGTDIQVCCIPEIFTFYEVINNFQPLDVSIFLCPCHYVPPSPPKKKIDSAPITDRQSEWHNCICLTSSLWPKKQFSLLPVQLQ